MKTKVLQNIQTFRQSCLKDQDKLVRTDGLTAEDPSQRDHAGVLGVVKFREPFPGNLP